MDREGKVRVVALVDYWTQMVLKPLHDGVDSLLKSIKADCTHNQSKFKTLLQKGEGAYGSVDLKSATDRMPV